MSSALPYWLLNYLCLTKAHLTRYRFRLEPRLVSTVVHIATRVPGVMICCNRRCRQSAPSLARTVITIIRALSLEIQSHILSSSFIPSFDCSNVIRYLNLAARPVETASRAFFSKRHF